MKPKSWYILCLPVLIALTACRPSSSISFGGSSGKTLSVSGAVVFLRTTVDATKIAGTLLIGTVQSLQREMQTRVEKVQQGATLIKEGIQ
jgi:hypothetical protein